jgi:hypothetical protein
MEVIVTLREQVTDSSLKSPGNTSVEGALYLRGRGVDEVWHKFQVPVVQQVLAANSEFHSRRWSPAEMSVHRVVAGYVEAGEPICVSNIQIVFKMFGKID